MQVQMQDDSCYSWRKIQVSMLCTHNAWMEESYNIFSTNYVMIHIVFSVQIQTIQVLLLITLQVTSVIQFPHPELSQLCSWVSKPYLVDQSSYSWNGIPEGICLQVTVCGHLDGAWGQVARSGMGAGRGLSSAAKASHTWGRRLESLHM
jgi:hypothetical protein